MKGKHEPHLRVEERGVKGRSFDVEERSTRERILLYCNSDVVVQKWSKDDYFPIFLLPKSAFIEIASPAMEKSWVEKNSGRMRILYYSCSRTGEELDAVVKQALMEVKQVKYSFSSSGGDHGRITGDGQHDKRD